VQVTVYRTRERALRLPAPTPGVHGHLQLDLWRIRYTRQLAATLTNEHDSSIVLIPALVAARVERIARNGIVIAGIEVIPRRGGGEVHCESLSADVVVSRPHRSR
jgi:hypothetical protein